MEYRIAVIPGDGIGPEVWAAGRPVIDAAVAKAYGAVCTPDFFGYNSNLELQYRGRLDACALTEPPPDRRRELVLAMRLVADTGKGPSEQMPSMGCSIKWRA